MNIQYEYHEGSQTIKPLAIDTTSSKSVVYLRRNIEQITRKDEQSGATIKLWPNSLSRSTRSTRPKRRQNWRLKWRATTSHLWTQ